MHGAAEESSRVPSLIRPAIAIARDPGSQRIEGVGAAEVGCHVCLEEEQLDIECGILARDTQLAVRRHLEQRLRSARVNMPLL